MVFDVRETVFYVRCFVGLLFCSRCLTACVVECWSCSSMFCSMLCSMFCIVGLLRSGVLFTVLLGTHIVRFDVVLTDVLFDVVFSNDIPHAGYFAGLNSMFCSLICVGLVCETVYCSSLCSMLCSEFLFCSIFSVRLQK